MIERGRVTCGDLLRRKVHGNGKICDVMIGIYALVLFFVNEITFSCERGKMAKSNRNNEKKTSYLPVPIKIKRNRRKSGTNVFKPHS